MAESSKNKSKSKSKRKRRRTIRVWVKRGLLAAVGVGAVVAIVMAMLPKPIPVDTAKASRGAMEVSVNADGKTRVKHRYTVIAPVTGNMPRIDAQPGDKVASEQVLFSLVPARSPLLNPRARAEAQARLAAALAGQRQTAAQAARAKVALEQAKSELARIEKLTAKGVSAKAGEDQARFAVRAAGEEVAASRFAVSVAAQQATAARAALGLLEKTGTKSESMDIEAPVSGQVLRVFRRDAGVVAAGARLIEIGDLGSLECVVDVLTRDAVHIKPGTPVMIERWGGGAVLKGHVHRVEPAAVTRVSALGVEEQRVDVIIDFDEERERFSALGDGFRVEARIIVWKSESVLKVPASAVFRRGEGWAVFAVRKGSAKLVPVTVGKRNPSHVEIVKGLAEGEEVIVHPSDRVEDGVDVVQRGDS